jgi:hypothetical protein
VGKILQLAVLGYTFIYIQIKHYYIIPYMYLPTEGTFKPYKDIVQLPEEPSRSGLGNVISCIGGYRSRTLETSRCVTCITYNMHNII